MGEVTLSKYPIYYLAKKSILVNEYTWEEATIGLPSPAPHSVALRIKCCFLSSPLAKDSLILGLMSTRKWHYNYYPLSKRYQLFHMNYCDEDANLLSQWKWKNPLKPLSFFFFLYQKITWNTLNIHISRYRTLLINRKFLKFTLQ